MTSSGSERIFPRSPAETHTSTRPAGPRRRDRSSTRSRPLSAATREPRIGHAGRSQRGGDRRRGRLAVADLVAGDPRGVVFGRSATELTMSVARTLAQTWRAGRRGRGHPARPRRQHPSVGDRCRAGGRPGALGRFRSGRAESCRSRRSRSPDHRSDPGGGSNRGQQPARHPARRRHDRGDRPRGGRAALCRRCALRRARSGRPGRAGGRLLRLLAVQVLRSAPRRCWSPIRRLLESLRPDKLLPSTDTVPERFELGTLPYEILAGTTAAIDFIAGLVDGGGTRRERLARSLAASRTTRHVSAPCFGRSPRTWRCGLPRRRRAGRTSTLLFDLPGSRRPKWHGSWPRAGSARRPAASTPSRRRGTSGSGTGGAVRVGLAAYSSEEDVHRLLARRGRHRRLAAGGEPARRGKLAERQRWAPRRLRRPPSPPSRTKPAPGPA